MANPLIFSEESSLPEVSCENISTGSCSEWFMVKFPFQIDIKAAALGNDKDIETCDNECLNSNRGIGFSSFCAMISIINVGPNAWTSFVVLPLYCKQ